MTVGYGISANFGTLTSLTVLFFVSNLEKLKRYLPLVVSRCSSLGEIYRASSFLFDEDGKWDFDLGLPESNKGINDAENLFGFDLNKDTQQAGLDIEEELEDHLERFLKLFKCQI